MNQHVKGVTVIELLIVIVIIGSLATIAVPSYTKYFARAEQTTAMSKLNEIAQAMERFYTENQRMTNNPVELGYSENQITNDYFTFNIVINIIDPTFYLITATTQAGVTAKVNYRINNLGTLEHLNHDSRNWQLGW